MSEPRVPAPAAFRHATGAPLAPPPWMGGPASPVSPAAFPRVGAPPAPEPRVAAPPPPPPPAPVAVVDPRLEAELMETIGVFARAAASLAAARAQVLATVERDLVDLSLAIASAVLEREIAKDPQLHVVLAHAALATIGDPQGVRLRASRAAHEAISEITGGGPLSWEGIAVEVILDETLEGLGVVAEGEAVRVDARIHERLRAVLRGIEDERVRAAEEAT